MARFPIMAVASAGLSSIPSVVGIEAASQSWKKGAPLIPSSGKLAKAAANPRTFLGFAEEAASAVTNTSRRFVPAHPAVIFEGTLSQASGLGLLASAQTHLYSEFGLTEDANGIWYIDIDKVTGGTNTMVYILDVKDPLGTVEGRVLFQVLQEVSFIQSA